MISCRGTGLRLEEAVVEDVDRDDREAGHGKTRLETRGFDQRNHAAPRLGELIRCRGRHGAVTVSRVERDSQGARWRIWVRKTPRSSRVRLVGRTALRWSEGLRHLYGAGRRRGGHGSRNRTA